MGRDFTIRLLAFTRAQDVIAAASPCMHAARHTHQYTRCPCNPTRPPTQLPCAYICTQSLRPHPHPSHSAIPMRRLPSPTHSPNLMQARHG